MKYQRWNPLWGTLILVALGWVVGSCSSPTESAPAVTATVKLGPQNGTISTGTVAAITYATFAVTTTNIAADTVGTVSWYSASTGTTAVTAPAGVLVGVSKVAANAATVSIGWQAGTTVPAAGSYYFKVTIGSATSATATLTVSPAGTPSILLGTQATVLTAGISGSVTILALTNNIPVGTTGTVSWYTTSAGSSIGTAPTGVSNTVIAVATYGSNTMAQIGFSTTSSTVEGTYYFKLTLGSATSSVGILTISPSDPTVTVSLGAPSGSLTAGSYGSISFPVTTTKVPDNSSGSVVWYTSASATTVTGAPPGLFSSATTVKNNATTFNVYGTAVEGGTFYFKVTCGSAVSAVTALMVGFPGPPSVSLGAQSGTLASGLSGTVTYTATLANLQVGTPGILTWYTSVDGMTTTSAPLGVTSAATPAANRSSTVTLAADATSLAGTYYFKATFGEATSAMATLTVSPSGTATVNLGGPVGYLIEGKAGALAYPVVTANLANGTPGTVTWFTTAAGTASSSNPPGVTATVSPVADNGATVTVAVDATTVAGMYYFRITAGTATSPVTVLTVQPKILMVPVSGGTFFSGTYNMTVSSFQMGIYDVTQAQYQAVMGTNPSANAVKPRYPVDSVSWYSLLVFCNTRSLQEGLTPAFSIGGSRDPAHWGPVPTYQDPTWDEAVMDLAANGYRLPTYAEWLWAAMGGQNDGQPGNFTGAVNTLGYKKPFAGFNGTNTLGDYAGTTMAYEVGLYDPNELGLFDMSGNIRQFCWDAMSLMDTGAPPSDYLGGTYTAYRVLLGTYDASNTTITNASIRVTYQGDRYTGFRVVRSVR